MCAPIMLALPSILGAPAPKVEANAAVLSYERQKQGATCQSCDAMVGKFAQLQQESRCADNDALYDAMVRSDAAVRFAENAPDMGQFSHYAIMSVGCNRADDLVSFNSVTPLPYLCEQDRGAGGREQRPARRNCAVRSQSILAPAPAASTVPGVCRG